MLEEENGDRRRFYGKRAGDIVTHDDFGTGVVEALGKFDNNSLVVTFNHKSKCIKVSAESCEIVKKIEDIQKERKEFEKSLIKINQNLS